MSGGLVSVVMPAFNEEAFIAEALASVLAQTYDPVEVIVVDDGSGDRTAEIAEGHDVLVLRRPHLGTAAARNAGLAVAQGEYWTIFDADDLMPSDRLMRQVAHLNEHPELDLVLGLTEAFVTPGEPKPRHFNPIWDDGPFPACVGTMMGRRGVLDAVGPFDESMRLSQDLDWLARAKDAGRNVGQVDHVCLHYRIHRANSTSDSSATHSAMLRLLRSSLTRRRAESADA